MFGSSETEEPSQISGEIREVPRWVKYGANLTNCTVGCLEGMIDFG